jgi:hypothetical protein
VWCGLGRRVQVADFTPFESCRIQLLWSIEACLASLAVLKKCPGLGAAGIDAPLPCWRK